MRFVVGLVLGFLAVAERTIAGESTTSRAQEHLRKACEIVWENAGPHQVERCIERAMGALGRDSQLRDHELKRLLVDSENELEACKDELRTVRNELTATRVSRGKRPDPSPPR